MVTTQQVVVTREQMMSFAQRLISMELDRGHFDLLDPVTREQVSDLDDSQQVVRSIANGFRNVLMTRYPHFDVRRLVGAGPHFEYPILGSAAQTFALRLNETVRSFDDELDQIWWQNFGYLNAHSVLVSIAPGADGNHVGIVLNPCGQRSDESTAFIAVLDRWSELTFLKSTATVRRTPMADTLFPEPPPDDNPHRSNQVRESFTVTQRTDNATRTIDAELFPGAAEVIRERLTTLGEFLNKTADVYERIRQEDQYVNMRAD